VKRVRVFSEELGQSLLVEQLLENDVRVDGLKISKLFEELEQLYPLNNNKWNILAKHLGFGSGLEAEYFCWKVLPEILEKENPKLLEALYLAAGQEYHNKGGEMETNISQEQRTMLIQNFWEDLSAIMTARDLTEVAVEFTGDPRSLVLLHLVKRYFRGRFVLPTIFTANPQDKKRIQYMEQIRARFGLDPIDAYDKQIFDLEEIQVVLVAGESRLETVYKNENISTEPILKAWNKSAIDSYIKMENLLVYDEPVLENPLDGWTKDNGGRYHHKGKIVATANVPDEVKEALWLEGS
jgi:hypothetical protein